VLVGKVEVVLREEEVNRRHRVVSDSKGGGVGSFVTISPKSLYNLLTPSRFLL